VHCWAPLQAEHSAPCDPHDPVVLPVRQDPLDVQHPLQLSAHPPSVGGAMQVPLGQICWPLQAPHWPPPEPQALGEVPF
jgi:hypothetical protein